MEQKYVINVKLVLCAVNLMVLAHSGHGFSKVLGEESDLATPTRQVSVSSLRKKPSSEPVVEVYKPHDGALKEAGANPVNSSSVLRGSNRNGRPVGAGALSLNRTESAIPDFLESAHDERTKGKVLSSEGLAIKVDIKTEVGEGIGENHESALQEAMRDVLQKVVGVYVDSDFRMNNDEIIKDEIITHSNGFIDHYKVLSTEPDEDGRGVKVTIRAWVKMQDFVNRMKKLAPRTVCAVDGALLLNEMGNMQNAARLLMKEVEVLNPIDDFLVLKLCDGVRPKIMDSTVDSVTMRYAIEVSYDRNRYFKEFLPRIERVLRQIAEGAPKERVVFSKMMSGTINPKNGHSQWRTMPVKITVLDTYRAHVMKGCKVAGYGGSSQWVSLVSGIAKGGAIKFHDYKIPIAVAKSFAEWREKAYVKRDVQLSVSLIDSAGEELAFAAMEVYAADLHGDVGPHQGQLAHFFPFFIMPFSEHWKNKDGDELMNLGHGNYINKLVYYVDVVVGKDDVGKIVAAELKFNNK